MFLFLVLKFLNKLQNEWNPVKRERERVKWLYGGCVMFLFLLIWFFQRMIQKILHFFSFFVIVIRRVFFYICVCKRINMESVKTVNGDTNTNNPPCTFDIKLLADRLHRYQEFEVSYTNFTCTQSRWPNFLSS